MPIPSRDIMVLALGQALTSTVISLLTSVSSLSGAYLAPSAVLSTLPVSATVLGTFIMIYPASALMGRLGRRKGFMFKASLGMAGVVLSATGCLRPFFAGQTLPFYILELSLAGIGWNFIFNGGTLLVANTYRPATRAGDAQPGLRQFSVTP